jgi:hypothetical protein
MSSRLYGSIEGWDFKIRHAAAIDIGAMTKWAEGNLEPTGKGTLIRFTFGPLRFLRWMQLFIWTMLSVASLVLIGSLIAQLLTRPASDVSDGLKAWAIIFPGTWFIMLGISHLMSSASNPESLIRLLNTLLEAEVDQRPAKGPLELSA